MRLYHATYTRNLESIKSNGLHPKFGKRNWAISHPNEIYLSTSKRIAKEYANKTLKEGDEIVILVVDYTKLNKRKLIIDYNAFERHKDKCFVYKDVVKPNIIISL